VVHVAATGVAEWAPVNWTDRSASLGNGGLPAKALLSEVSCRCLLGQLTDKYTIVDPLAGHVSVTNDRVTLVGCTVVQ
jgi:hypothetical protein